MVNWVLQPCYRKIKVSDEVCFMEIGVTMATLRDNSSFYIFSISIDSRAIFGKCSCDLIVGIIVSRSSEYKQILWERFWDIFDEHFWVYNSSANKVIKSITWNPSKSGVFNFSLQLLQWYWTTFLEKLREIACNDIGKCELKSYTMRCLLCSCCPQFVLFLQKKSWLKMPSVNFV